MEPIKEKENKDLIEESIIMYCKCGRPELRLGFYEKGYLYVQCADCKTRFKLWAVLGADLVEVD